MNKELTEEQVRLVEENMSLVRQCALNWATKENYTEVYNASLIGLVTATQHYQVDKGMRFLSFALCYIRREINMNMSMKR